MSTSSPGGQSRHTALIAAAATSMLLLLGLVVAIPLLLQDDPADCGPGQDTGLGDAVAVAQVNHAPVGRWHGDQLSNAAAIISAGKRLGVPARAQAIAVMTAMGETSLLVADHGDATGPDSRGLFQQRANGAWGSYTDRMDPTTGATNFYKALLRVDGWGTLPPTEAAHRTQHNADPNYYTQFWPDAVTVVSELTGTVSETISSTSVSHTTGNTSGTAAASSYPLGNVQPQLRALVAVLGPKFAIKTIGGYRASATDPRGHPSGLAADFMTQTQTQGDQLAAYAQSHAHQLGIDYVLWRQRIWSTTRASEGWRVMADRGSPTENHRDHVHINVTPEADPAAIAAQAADSTETGPQTTADCSTAAPGVGGGDTVYPLPAGSGYTDQHNWGGNGTHWAHGHTGTDLSVSCGTPVLAAHAGTVVIRRDQTWAGPQLVQVTHGPGQLTTWYAHMQTANVANGQQVQPGQQIGQVGDLGNATGCHLHFEVHPKGGTIYADDINASTWLTQNVGKTTNTSTGPAATFMLVSLNVLGSSHTNGSGHSPGRPPGPVRMRAAVQLLNSVGADVVGLQELQRDQAAALSRLAPGYHYWYPPGESPENAVAWKASRFSLVRGASQPIPYFHGNIRRMPVVLLRDRTTNKQAWFMNVHNPADVHGPAGRWRTEATRREVANARTLVATGVPVFLTGDMNARSEAFCQLTADNVFTAAAGGSHLGGTCRAPRGGIDWILGTSGTRFSGWTLTRTALVRAATDHPIAFTRAAF